MSEFNFIENPDDSKQVISSTGYRTLKVLKSLIENDYSLEELTDIIKKDDKTGNAVSKDTVRICLNTLKNAGCQMTRPSKTNNFKYHLISHPFVLNLDDKELKLLLRLRENMSPKTPWQDFFTVNSLYSKITWLTFNFVQIGEVNDSALFSSVNKEVINALYDKNIFNKKVLFEYKSPEYGIEDIYAVPLSVLYENGKLYLKCYVYKYDSSGLLNIENIYGIKEITPVDKIKFKPGYFVEYELTGESVKKYTPKENEEILEKNDTNIKVKAYVTNEFRFIQRILLFGTDFKIISPDFFKEKLIHKLNLIKSKYE